jgi:uncharacterized protein YxeA
MKRIIIIVTIVVLSGFICFLHKVQTDERKVLIFDDVQNYDCDTLSFEEKKL